VATRNDNGRRRTRAPSISQKDKPGQEKAQGAKPAPGPRAKPIPDRPAISADNLAKARKTLAECVRRLGHIQARAVTVELALRGNNAEQDSDIEQCVRVDICDALFVEVGKLIAVGRRLGVNIRNPFDT
jgi:hypothetical protein